jgi:hypothetical protein
MYIMSTGLTLQTDREIRYEQKIQRRKVEQQSVDRVNRLQTRENNRTTNVMDKSEIADEVSSEINLLAQRRKRNATTRYSNFVSFFS